MEGREVISGRELEPGLQPQPSCPIARIYSMFIGLKGPSQKDVLKHALERKMGGSDRKEGILKL